MLNTKNRTNKKQLRLGFTLIELIVVIVIIGILASVAVPMYNSYVKNSKEKSAIALQRDLIGILDSHYNLYGVFPADPTATATSPLTAVPLAADIDSTATLFELFTYFTKSFPMNPFCTTNQDLAGDYWTDIYATDSTSLAKNWSLNQIGITYELTAATQTTPESIQLEVSEDSATSTGCKPN